MTTLLIVVATVALTVLVLNFMTGENDSRSFRLNDEANLNLGELAEAALER